MSRQLGQYSRITNCILKSLILCSRDASLETGPERALTLM